MTSTAHTELRISSHPLPAGAWVARQLRAEGVYAPALLERAAAWGSDFARAWASCDELGLLLPLARLGGRSMDRVTRVARDWTVDVLGALGGAETTWSVTDRDLLERCLAEAVAPDPVLDQLVAWRGLALQRAAARGPGKHRGHMLAAAARVASLGLQRFRTPMSVGADAAMLAEHLVGALRDEAGVDGSATLDLFLRFDVDVVVSRLLVEGRAALEDAAA